MAIHLAERPDNAEIAKSLREIYAEMTCQAEKLGMYGAAIQYIAEEVKRLADRYV